MIKYILKCDKDHEFESWFSNSNEFEKLSRKDLLECIFCSSKKISKSIEIVYGLRNFIGNANKFAKNTIFINLKSDSEITEITVEDDGNGYPRDIISKIGEPYLKSLGPSNKEKTGLGLGIFIGKTLLEKNSKTLQLHLFQVVSVYLIILFFHLLFLSDIQSVPFSLN